MKKLLSLKNIFAGYNGKIILEDINFEVLDNDFIGIIGPNGGGKTTLLKVMIGLLKPVRGVVEYDFSLKSNKIGYLPQQNDIDYQFPITVKEVVLSGFMSHKKPFKRFTGSQKEKACKMLEQVGMHGYRNDPVGELSGGQLQKVLLSRALVASPELLILDEPNTFVDNKFEGELYSLLSELNKEMAIIIVSHDIGMISSSVKSIACVNRRLHHHKSNKITEKQLQAYDCPIQLITHGKVPHTVLENHD